ncbi:MAG: TrmH family RNA methyltransferase, partial [Acidimicrobiia bacterium]
MPSARAATPDEMFELIAGRRTDDPYWFNYGDTLLAPRDIFALLGDRVSADRQTQLRRVVDERTRNVSVVVEGMVDLGNVGAVMRSADGFGVQTVHAVDTADAYKRSRRTSRGAEKWIDRYRWEDPSTCVTGLRDDGYQVLIADPGPGAAPIEDVDLTQRTAIVLGNELDGISDDMRSQADGAVSVQMSGFAESFNVAVAAALALYEIRRQRIAAFGRNGDLTETERDHILAVWYLKSVRESRLIVERALD